MMPILLALCLMSPVTEYTIVHNDCSVELYNIIGSSSLLFVTVRITNHGDSPISQRMLVCGLKDEAGNTVRDMSLGKPLMPELKPGDNHVATLRYTDFKESDNSFTLSIDIVDDATKVRLYHDLVQIRNINAGRETRMWRLIVDSLEYREWTDKTGKFRVNAAFIEFKVVNGKSIVVLKRRDNGKVINVGLYDLSENDKKWLRQRRRPGKRDNRDNMMESYK